MTQISYKSYDSLPDDVESFSDLEKLSLVICPEVVFPILPDNDFRLETQTEFLSYNYRIKFLHPSLYCGAAFANRGYAKLDVLRKLAKRGATIVFIVDSQRENSLINACCFLGECFNDCRNSGMDLTNIPFPVKKADSQPNDWIWSCYWNERIPNRLDEKQSKEFIDTVSLNFPKYDSRYFPVKDIGPNDEGVTAFSVKVGEGWVHVKPPSESAYKSETVEVPAQDKILITVNEFPRQLSLADNLLKVKYDILYKGDTYSKQAPGLGFLRLLTVYYASQGDNSFGLTINDDNELDNVSVMNAGSHPERIEWACIFKSPNGTADLSFLKTLSRFIKLVLPKEHEDEAYQIVTGRHPGGHRKQKDEFIIEKLNNLVIKFSDEAFCNFESFTLRGKKPRDAAFTSVLATFKSSISLVVKP